MSAKQSRRLATADEIKDALLGYDSKRMSPQPLEKPAGAVQHFATGADRQAYFDWLEVHEHELPF